MSKSQLGLIGLAVMGENLVLNMTNQAIPVSVYNRTQSKVDTFIQGRGAGKPIYGAKTLEDLVLSLESPRKIMLMVKAGPTVDTMIEQLLPLLDKGDILIDGGNSHFNDTNRRTAFLEQQGFLFIGTGVSGGEEGALLGPSIMPGGSPKAWESVKPIFQAIAAKVDDDAPCCDWVGKGGAGHFVKMVHNGIEYGDMQLIAEAYHLMYDLLGLSHDRMAAIFNSWNQRELDSYLIEITRDILGFKDTDNEPLLEKILDAAGQKGTGKWTGITALELGVPLTLIGEAVFARCLSAIKEERVTVSSQLPGFKKPWTGNTEKFILDLEAALFASKIVSYAQGFALMKAASNEYQWDLEYGNIALLWRGGCIIRSAFLEDIKTAFTENPDLPNLLLAPYFKEKVLEAQSGWRNVISAACTHGIPVPAMASALMYYDGYRTPHLPANLIQAQRDYFGAHTYERKDRPRGEFFHTNWTGRGGDTTSTTYDV